MSVLIADDDPVRRRLVAALVTAWGHAPLVASDGEEAWRLMATCRGPIVAILALDMDGSGGAELCRRLRLLPLLGDSHVVMLTSRAPGQAARAVEAGADDFVTAPVDRLDLRMKVQAGVRLVELRRELARQSETLRRAERMRDALRSDAPACAAHRECASCAALREKALDGPCVTSA